MRYREVQEYILKIPKFTKKNSQEHTKCFLAALGNPEKGKKIIHVAGTNGKGSVCTYLDAMLRAQGKKTGLFISPHLVRLNERIRINGCPVSDEEFVHLFDRTKQAVEVIKANGLLHPSFFEFLFGMAMAGFEEAGVDYIILETGLGGRLDATNAVSSPTACIITSIGLDHMDILGGTIEEIAAEKAGIIKQGVPVFYADTQEAAGRVIEKIAEEKHAPCKKIGKDAYEILGIQSKHIAFSCTNAYYGDTTWTLHNQGIYQPENAMLALETMRQLFGPDGKTERWRQAIAAVRWEGRMEEVLPDFYVDGAHNVSAVERFADSVLQIPGKRILLFSAVKDKDYRAMIACLCRRVDADFYLITLIEDERATRVEELKRIFEQYTERPVIVKEDLKEALFYAKEHQEGRVVYCLGSLYLAGMIKSFIKEVE